MTDRISLLIKAKNLSAAQFADEIGVQRSSISHLMSGRNKPSLDLIQKTLQRFPEVSTEWLLFGKGEMVRELNLFDSQLRFGSNESNGKLALMAEPVILNQEMERSINKAEIQTSDPDINVIAGKEATNRLSPSMQGIGVQSPDLEEKAKSSGGRNEFTEASNQVHGKISSKNESAINQIIVLYENRTFVIYSPGN